MLSVLEQTATRKVNPMTATITEVVGKAIYIETVPSGWVGGYDRVSQTIILPSYKSDSGDEHLPQVMSRNVNGYSPRAQWDFSQFNLAMSPEKQPEISEDKLSNFRNKDKTNETHSQPKFIHNVDGYEFSDEDKQRTKDYELLDQDTKSDYLANGLSYALKTELFSVDVDNNISLKQELRTGSNKSVFVVEVTNEEMEQVIARRTPQSLIRRIQKVRVANGLPDKVVSAL